MLVVKNLLASVGDTSNPVGSLDQEDLLEEGVATHSSILAWRIPMDRGVWQATIYKVPQSQTQLK